MFFRGLKINITFNLVVILAAGMILIDFVVMFSAKNLLIRSELSKARIIVSSLESDIGPFLEKGNGIFDTDMKYRISRITDQVKGSSVLVRDNSERVLFFKLDQSILGEKVLFQTVKAEKSGKMIVGYFGQVWGIFHWERKYAVLSMPIFLKNNRTVGISLVISLEPVYNSLRRIQTIVWLYILINIIVLTMLGRFQISRLTVKPLKRLLKTAEDYREGPIDFLLFDKTSNEFTELSSALNNMLSKISEDRERLTNMVKSLEAANSELNQARKDIVRAEKLASVGRLASGIAHEIGNPIGIVLGYIDLLKQQDIPPEEKKDFLDRIEKEISRINTIIRRMLDYARPSEEGMKPVSMHEIVKEVKEILFFHSKDPALDSRLDLKAKFDTVYCNPDHAKQVFLNIMINAADAVKGKGQGKLTISTKNEPSRNADTENLLAISFMDNGHGIPEKDVDNIFDPFFTSKQPGEGTGLGLYVSLQIIETMNGTIDVNSEEGKGTTITIFLPVWE